MEEEYYPQPLIQANFPKRYEYSLFIKFGFIEQSPDLDGMYNGAIIPARHSLFLWRSSWITLITVFVSFIRGHYDITICALIVFITSINYWKFPDYSWRRYLDISCVVFSLFYEFIIAYYSVLNHHLYYLSLFLCILFFPVGIYFKNTSPWMSTFIHVLVHVFGNVSNIVLCFGDLTPFSIFWGWDLPLPITLQPEYPYSCPNTQMDI